jgi:hypothetical protein
MREMCAQGVPPEERVFGTLEDGVRPCSVQPIECQNVLIEGVTFLDSPSWAIHPVLCENLINITFVYDHEFYRGQKRDAKTLASEHVTRIRHIDIKDINCKSAKTALRINGVSDYPIETEENVFIRHAMYMIL